MGSEQCQILLNVGVKYEKLASPDVSKDSYQSALYVGVALMTVGVTVRCCFLKVKIPSCDGKDKSPFLAIFFAAFAYGMS